MEVIGADSSVLSDALLGVLVSIAVSTGFRLTRGHHFTKAAIMLGVAIVFCGLYEWWQVRISRPITQAYYTLDEYRLGESLDTKH